MCVNACIYMDMLSDDYLETSIFSLSRVSGNEKWNGCERGTEKTSESRGRKGVSVGN